jgi:hypothetical protein
MRSDQKFIIIDFDIFALLQDFIGHSGVGKGDCRNGIIVFRFNSYLFSESAVFDKNIVDFSLSGLHISNLWGQFEEQFLIGFIVLSDLIVSCDSDNCGLDGVGFLIEQALFCVLFICELDIAVSEFIFVRFDRVDQSEVFNDRNLAELLEISDCFFLSDSVGEFVEENLVVMIEFAKNDLAIDTF